MKSGRQAVKLPPRMPSPSRGVTSSTTRSPVGWAKALLRRAHHLSSSIILNGGHAPLCPPYGFGLLGQQREGAVPVIRRRIFEIAADADFVEIVDQPQRIRLVGSAAACDGRERAFPVAVAVAGEHFDGQVAQALEAAGLRGVLA